MNVGIVGLGYVGLPLAVAFCEAGHNVIGVDVDPRKIGALQAGESYVEDVSDETLAAIADRLFPTRRFAELSRWRPSSSRCRRRSRRTESPTSARSSRRQPPSPRSSSVGS